MVAIYDSEYYNTARGFYQHRRSQIAGLNGEGQPLENDILEGEIAINLATRQLYTKRPVQTKTETAETVTGAMSKAGYMFRIIGAISDSDFDITVDGTTVTVTNDPNPNVLANNMTAAAPPGTLGNTREFHYNFAASGTRTFDVSDMFGKVEFQIIPIIRVPVSDRVPFISGDTLGRQIGFDYVSGSLRRTNANATFLETDTVTNLLYVVYFNGDYEINREDFELSLFVNSDSEEIIEISNVPIVQPESPKHALSDGKWWIQNRAENIGGLYWLDTSIVDDSDIQASIVSALPGGDSDSDYLRENNLVPYGNGYAEYRIVFSPSKLADASSTFTNDITFSNGTITFDSDTTLDVYGQTYFHNDIELDRDHYLRVTSGSELILDSDSTVTLWGETFNNTVAFSISDAAGNRVFRMHGFTDSE